MSKHIKTEKTVIDIDERSVRVICTNGKGKIVKTGVAELPDATQAGYVPALTAAIKAAASAAGVKGGPCVVVTGEADIIINRFSFPDLPRESLLENVKIEMSSYLPDGIASYILDYTVTGKEAVEAPEGSEAAGAMVLDLFAAAAHISFVQSIMTATSSAKFTVKRLDIRENAREKLMAATGVQQLGLPGAGVSFAVLDIASSPANIAVYINGKFSTGRYFAPKIPGDFAEMAAGADTGGAGGILAGIAAEVSSIIDYIQYRTRDSKVECIFLFGAGSEALAALSESMDIPIVEAGSKYTSLVSKKHGTHAKKDEIAAYLDAFGASIIRSTKLSPDLNLKPYSAGGKEKAKTAILAACLVLIAGILASAGFYLPYRTIEGLKDDERALDGQLEQYSALSGFSADEIRLEISRMNDTVGEFLAFMEEFPDPQTILNTLYGNLPANSDITSLNMSNGMLIAQGHTTSLRALADYADRLYADEAGVFSGVKTQNINSSDDEVSFSLILTISTPEDLSE